MAQQDICWQQRFSNYNRAIVRLSEALSSDTDNFSELERDGVIQRFEYTYELAWKVMKDYLEYQGNANIRGSRDAVREAFKSGLVRDGHLWMDMIADRNEITHTYDEKTAGQIFLAISERYYPLLLDFQIQMEEIASSQSTQFE